MTRCGTHLPDPSASTCYSSKDQIQIPCASRGTPEIPSIELVIAREFCFSTPRICIHVLSFDDDSYPKWFDLLFNGLGDLGCQAFLYLEPAAVHFDQSGDLTYPDNFLVGKIAHMAFTEKRKQVMLAHAEEIYIGDNHHLIILNIEQCIVQQFIGILRISFGKKPQRLFDATRRPSQSLSVRIFTKILQNLSNKFLHQPSHPQRAKFKTRHAKRELSRLRSAPECFRTVVSGDAKDEAESRILP